MVTSPIESIPVALELFRVSGDQVELMGSRCAGCGVFYFPKRSSCCNPACTRKAVGDVPLSRRGILYSYTVQSYRPPTLFRMEPWAPYAIGQVQLPEGLRVMGLLRDVALDEIAIGMPVQLGVEPLCTDERGHQVLTYVFRPFQQSGSAA